MKLTSIGVQADDSREQRMVILSRILFVLTFILTLLLMAIRQVIDPEPLYDLLLSFSYIFVNEFVGLLIISRYPNHKVGWLLFLLGFAFFLMGFSGIFAAASERSWADPGNLIVAFFAWMAQWVWFVPIIILFVFIPLYFPDGRLPSIRWRIIALAGWIALLSSIASLAVYPCVLDTAASCAGDPQASRAAIGFAQFMGDYVAASFMMLAIVGSFVSVILRFRRAASVQRTQIKWVLYVMVLGIGIIFLEGSFMPYVLQATNSGTINNISNLLIQAFAIALPVVIGTAILRHRLFDIDIIIRKTLVYALLSGLLALVYFGLVILLQSVIESASGQQSPIAIVISTLVIPALFAPLRRRVQEFIDRRFFRKKYDAQQVLAQFPQTARDETDMERLTAELSRVVQETMQTAACYGMDTMTTFHDDY